MSYLASWGRILRVRRVWVTSAFAFCLIVLYFGTSKKRIQYAASLVPFLVPHKAVKNGDYYSQSDSRYYYHDTRPFFPPLTTEQLDKDPTNLCSNFPTHMLHKVQVVLKTGVGESTRNKAHLQSVTSCIDNLLIFSDLEEKWENRHFIDILANLTSPYHTDNPDFAAYYEQKKAHSQGEDVGSSKAGWRLDRFKFLAMVDQAFDMRPDAEWFVFIEADIYVFWDNMFRFLDQLDSKRPHYLGSPVSGANGHSFAYGGGGIVVSRGLMRMLTEKDTRMSDEYAEWVKKDCCGDAVLAYAILDKTKVHMEGLYPMFTGEEISTQRITEEKWCMPVLSLHRVSAEQMKALWQWERTRTYETNPIMFSTLLQFTHLHLKDGPRLESWDNLSEAPILLDKQIHSSASLCEASCLNDSTCLQWSYSGETCKFDSSICAGHAVEPKNINFISGWNVKILNTWGLTIGADMSTGCAKATWKRGKVW